MKTRKVYIYVKKGVVQCVIGSHAGIDVTILDMDGDYEVENEKEWTRVGNLKNMYTLS